MTHEEPENHGKHHKLLRRLPHDAGRQLVADLLPLVKKKKTASQWKTVVEETIAKKFDHHKIILFYHIKDPSGSVTLREKY